jgi:hypothetical protein
MINVLKQQFMYERSRFATSLIIVLVASLCHTPKPSFAQEFGGNSPEQKWMQIDTDTVRVIYPKNLDEQAQRVANTVHYLNKYSRRSIGQEHKKIDVVLQNQSVISNGYVGLAPFRSEFYLNEPQNTFNLGSNWLDMLSIHEYRHALQFVNSRQGLTKVAYYLTGQLGWSYFSSLSIPNWFWEGDAVVSETALTAQGRGRIPAFYNGYKSLVFHEKTYNYQKARNGSLKDFVPNHYELGFLLCNYGREVYGNDFWKDVVADAGKYKGLLYPFSKATQRKTGMKTNEFYLNAMGFYGTQWGDQQNRVDASTEVSLREKQTFTTYQFPYQLENGHIIAYKASFEQIGGFYEIDGKGNERLIKRQGMVLDNYYSYKNGKIAWAELGQDERWSWQTRSNIVVYDTKTKSRKRITSSARYFSPDLSGDGKRIVVFHATPDLDYNLLIISGEDGTQLVKIDNPHNVYYSYPKWTLDGRHILALARDGLGRVALVKVSISSGNQQILVPFSNHQLGIPHETADFVFFSASFTGADNIFAYSKENGDILQVTDGNVGSYQAFANENELVFSRFSYLGNDLMRLKMNENDWKPISIIEPADMAVYDFVAVEAEGEDITQKIPGHTYETQKYAKASKLINLHSWSLYFLDPNYEWSIKSNNILNTLNMDLGIRYNRNDQAFTYFFAADYAQYYPLISFSASVGRRNALTRVVDQNNVVVDTLNVGWWESMLRPGLTLPFNLSSGLYSRQLNLSGYYSFTHVDFTSKTTEALPEIANFNYDSYTAGFSFLNQRKKARKNIFAKNSQYVTFSYDRLIDTEQVDQIFFDSEWTFPGLAINHNLVFQASYQREDPESFPRFGDNFFYARGYDRPLYDHIYKIGTNYHFPLVYPDWGFWGILYIYRLRANAFFDYSRAHYNTTESGFESIQMYNSTGGELIFDTKVLNLYDLTFGFRYSYLINENPADPSLNSSFEFFIPIARF